MKQEEPSEPPPIFYRNEKIAPRLRSSLRFNSDKFAVFSPKNEVPLNLDDQSQKIVPRTGISIGAKGMKALKRKGPDAPMTGRLSRQQYSELRAQTIMMGDHCEVESIQKVLVTDNSTSTLRFLSPNFSKRSLKSRLPSIKVFNQAAVSEMIDHEPWPVSPNSQVRMSQPVMRYKQHSGVNLRSIIMQTPTEPIATRNLYRSIEVDRVDRSRQNFTVLQSLESREKRFDSSRQLSQMFRSIEDVRRQHRSTLEQRV